jgi:hypothetical protein
MPSEILKRLEDVEGKKMLTQLKLMACQKTLTSRLGT